MPLNPSAMFLKLAQKTIFTALVWVCCAGLLYSKTPLSPVESGPTPSSPQSETKSQIPETQPENLTSFATLSFFGDPTEKNTNGSSVKLSGGEKFFFCVTLSLKDARLAPLASQIRKVHLVLTGDAENAQRLELETLSFLLPSNSAESLQTPCLFGRARLPKNFTDGKYSVAEFDLVLKSGRVASLREFLSQVSPQGLVQVDSGFKDLAPPKIVWIKPASFSKLSVHTGGHRVRARVHFQVKFQDEDEVDQASVRVFLKAFVDGSFFDTLEARCKPSSHRTLYRCVARFSRAEPDLKGRDVQIVFDRILASDKAGNSAEWSAEELKEFLK